MEEQWHKHTPGDPMPCDPESILQVVMRQEARDNFVPLSFAARGWEWGERPHNPNTEITDWRFVERKGRDVLPADPYDALEWVEDAGDRDLSRVVLRGALVDSQRSLTECRAERDAAWRAGAEAMREAAALAAVNVHNARIRSCRMGSDWINGHGIGSSDALDAIRSLPIPDQPKEGA